MYRIPILAQAKRFVQGCSLHMVADGQKIDEKVLNLSNEKSELK